jgi:hypothetical protein
LIDDGVKPRSDLEIRAVVTMDRTLFGQIVRTACRRPFRLYRIGGGVVGTLGLLSLPAGGGSGIVMAGVGLLLLCMPELILLWSYRRLAALPHEPWSYRITAEAIEESTPMSTSTRPWTRVQSADETNALWLLRTEPDGFIGLPKRALSLEERVALRALLTERGFVST